MTFEKRCSRYHPEDETIDIKPPIELIADEYDLTDGPIQVNIFAKSNYSSTNLKAVKSCFLKIVQAESNIKTYNLSNAATFESDLETISEESKAVSGLIFIFLADWKKEGTFILDNKTKTEYETEKIWSKFTSTNCPHMKNKPKVFLFDLDPYVPKYVTDATSHRTFKYEDTYDTPSEADIIIIYKQNVLDEDSDFLENFCTNIDNFAYKEDIITLACLTEQSYSPIIVSTLTRKLYLARAEERGHHYSIKENTELLDKHLNEIDEKVSKLTASNSNKKKNSFLKKFFSFKERNEEEIAEKKSKRLEKTQSLRVSKDKKEREKLAASSAKAASTTVKKDVKAKVLAVKQKELQVQAGRQRLNSESRSRRASVASDGRPPWR